MNFIKKMMVKKAAKKAAKKGAQRAIEREIKIATAAAVTFALHKGYQKLSKKYPKLKVLNIRRHA